MAITQFENAFLLNTRPGVQSPALKKERKENYSTTGWMPLFYGHKGPVIHAHVSFLMAIQTCLSDTSQN